MEYHAVVTDIGTKKMLEAVHEGRKVNITEFAVGDGGGEPYIPETGAVELKNEIWRGNVNSCCISDESENILQIETVIPSDVGGFTIREMGVFDDEGTLIAVCNTPDTQKVKITDGVVHELDLIMEIALANIDGVELVVDPCVLFATKKDIENIKNRINEYIGSTNKPDGGLGFDDGIQADNIIDAINEVFQSGNEKKEKLVSNLVAMGVEADTGETWEKLLDKVLDMTDTSKDTVTENVLLDGYTAHDAAGKLITGTMPDRASVTVDTTGVTQDSSYTYFGVPEGHYDENSKVRAINSDLGDKKINRLKVGTLADDPRTQTFNIKTLLPNHYQALTNDNFGYILLNFVSYIHATENRKQTYNFPALNYNSNTGILTTSGGFIQRDGAFQHYLRADVYCYYVK